MTLRTAILSTSTYASPPLHYGGEVFYWHLARGLCELGHEVTLYGAPGSRPPHPWGCRCRLRYIPGTYGNIDVAREFLALDWYGEEILGHDYVIDCAHNHPIAEHVGWFRRKDQVRVATVLNGVTCTTPRCGPFNVVVGSQKWKALLVAGRTQFYGTAFETQFGASLEEAIPETHIAGVVPWATDVEEYTPNPDLSCGSYFLWLSRPTPYKGLSDALRLASELRLNLVIVPGIGQDSHRREFLAYDQEIRRAREEGAQVTVVRLPRDSRHQPMKRELLRNARALLLPLLSHEPFGLVMVEALACGTPVISYHMGAVPEIVQDGVTGFVCRDYAAMRDAIGRVDQLDRAACRKDAEARWHYTRAAQEYVKILTE